MRAGQSDYHDAREREVSVHLDDGTALLVGRIVTDATGYGPRAAGHCSSPWTSSARKSGGLQCAVATTW
jgi:hypothetical protein